MMLDSILNRISREVSVSYLASPPQRI
jgi:hypothetical protein